MLSKGPLGDARVICEGYKQKHLSTCKVIEKVVFWRFAQREHRAQADYHCRDSIAENVLLFEHLQNLICNSKKHCLCSLTVKLSIHNTCTYNVISQNPHVWEQTENHVTAQ